MNKKVICGIIAVIVVVAIVIAVVLINNNKNVTIDLQDLNTKFSEKAPFNEMATMDIDAEVLSTLYDINSDQIEEVIGKMPLMNVQASMYLVIKTNENSVDAVKEKVESYAQAQEQMWSTYLPDQYDLVKARKQGVKGNYVYLIISENAAELEKLINK